MLLSGQMINWRLFFIVIFILIMIAFLVWGRCRLLKIKYRLASLSSWIIRSCSSNHQIWSPWSPHLHQLNSWTLIRQSSNQLIFIKFCQYQFRTFYNCWRTTKNQNKLFHIRSIMNKTHLCFMSSHLSLSWYLILVTFVLPKV